MSLSIHDTWALSCLQWEASNPHTAPEQELQVVPSHLSQHRPHHHLRDVPLVRRCAEGCGCQVSGALRLSAGLWGCGVKHRRHSGPARAQVSVPACLMSSGHLVDLF